MLNFQALRKGKNQRVAGIIYSSFTFAEQSLTKVWEEKESLFMGCKDIT